ncbi:putative transcription factor interactor and regulator CCHC(Zn) family [Rosa chinensis]|uniref:Putative transcription factor interactor and regulator CCHC(Zn) family n=1 Tax=Rosa chinensis TaxID=74649 RepID=A0A2P6PDN8_ROSCH|nr:putative transcription factor interactor and regulator CCHC(Zn) family [Rosa chinensis]
MKIYHGGNIFGNKYVGGKISYYDYVDKDKMSLTEVDNMEKGLNPDYGGSRIDYWFRIGSEDDALTKLNSDLDVMTMVCCVPDERLVILYLDHIYEGDEDDNEEDEVYMYPADFDFMFSQSGSTGVVIEELPDEPRQKPTCVIEEIFDDPKKLTNETRKPKRSTGIVIKEVDDCTLTQGSKVSDANPKEKGKGKLFPEARADESFGCMPSQEKRVEDEFEEDDSEKDEDYIPAFEDEDYDYGIVDDEDEVLDEQNIGLEVNAIGEWLGPSIHGSETHNVEFDSGAEFQDNEEMFGVADSDEERPGPALNSDGEEDVIFPEFNPKTDMQNPVFCKGMIFGTSAILREAIRERAIRDGWEVYFIKNDKTRVRAICRAQDCPFELYASRMQHESSVQIKTYEHEHNCSRKFESCMLSAKYLTKRFMERIKLNTGWKTESLAQTMSSEVRVKVSKQMAYRVKKAAILALEGTIKEQYARLRDYGNELKRVDPSTTIDIKCDFNNSNKDPVFKRMYICHGALKKGFKAGCRSVIGLDGCHLRSAFGGQLLIAVGIDANNTTWVISYAMVEMESKDSWIWFLELLCKDLSIREDGAGWTFISDKQKGLLPAFEEVVPSAHIRWCVRHMWTNFTKLFPGKVLRDQMWACAKSTTIHFFTKELDEMKLLNNEAYKWMMHEDRPAKHWCRAHFNTCSNCDIMINNLCESFNSYIFDARGKPPVSMFEEIRGKLMKRIQLRREKMQSMVGNICPKPRDILEKNKVKGAADCIPNLNGGDICEVENIEGSKNVVDLNARTCTCRRWELSGVPCKHAVSAIYHKRHSPEDYVADCYLIKTYMSIYDNLIQPINGMEMWSRSEEACILPPQYSRQPGRPKTVRRRDASEKLAGNGTKLGRIQKSLKCGNCGRVGHNVKTCHRHLPPKDKNAANKKRKMNSGDDSSTQPKPGKKPPLSKNELRKKHLQVAEYQRVWNFKFSWLTLYVLVAEKVVLVWMS